jgi:hypothetical protein
MLSRWDSTVNPHSTVTAEMPSGAVTRSSPERPSRTSWSSSAGPAQARIVTDSSGGIWTCAVTHAAGSGSPTHSVPGWGCSPSGPERRVSR